MLLFVVACALLHLNWPRVWRMSSTLQGVYNYPVLRGAVYLRT